MAVDRGRQLAHPSARIVDDEDREAGLGGALGTGRVREHRHRAQARGLRHEVGAVQPGAGQGGVEVTRAHGPGVVGDARDLGRSGGGDTQLIGEVRQVCGGDLNRSRRPRKCHRNALLGDLGLISVWHGGERTGRAPG